MTRLAGLMALLMAFPATAEDTRPRIDAALVATETGLTDQDPALVLGGLRALDLLGVTDAPDAQPAVMEQAALSAMLWARGDQDLVARLAKLHGPDEGEAKYHLRAHDTATDCAPILQMVLVCHARPAPATVLLVDEVGQ